MNHYATQLLALQQQPNHVLKEIGDQWQTPKALALGLFAHFSQKIGAIVLDLFANDGNQLAPNYYTAEINAMTQDWAGDLRQFGGAAFANPPYSRPCVDEDGTPITGIEHVLQYCREQREQGAKIMLLLKAATSDGWWPEDADFIQFVSGRIGFQAPAWYVPRDPKKDKPSSSGFASAVIIFDKEWKWERRPVERLSRHVLEAQGQIIIDMIESRALSIAEQKMSQLIPGTAEEIKWIPATGEQVESEGLGPVIDDAVEQSPEVDAAADDTVADDNYRLDFKDEEPEEDYSDKTVEQIYAMDDETIPLLRIIMLTLLFGKKTEYSHREIQFAMSSLLTNGEATNAEYQCENAVAIYIAMQEFMSKHEVTLLQQHDFVYAMFILCLQPSAEPLYKNVKTLIKISDVYTKCGGDIEDAIEKLDSGDNVVTEQTNEPASDTVVLADTSDDSEPSAEWVKEKCMIIDHFTEFSDEQMQESVGKIIQAVNDVYSEIPHEQLAEYDGKEYAVYCLTQLNPHARTLLNIRSLRAEFRSLVKPPMKEAAPCLEA